MTQTSPLGLSSWSSDIVLIDVMWLVTRSEHASSDFTNEPIRGFHVKIWRKISSCWLRVIFLFGTENWMHVRYDYSMLKFCKAYPGNVAC